MRGKKTIFIAAIMAAMATFIVILSQNNSRMNDEIQRLHSQLADAEKLRAENEKLAKTQSSTNEPALTADQMSELLRLRGQVGALKRQMAETAKSGVQSPSLALSPSVDSNDREKQAALIRQQTVAKANYARNWLSAFAQYAEDHQGQFPTSFDQAAKFLGDDRQAETLLATNQFEIVYRGSRDGVANAHNAILLRETQATQLPDSSWGKVYGYVDGSSEFIKTPDGNFGPWERGRLQQPPGQ